MLNANFLLTTDKLGVIYLILKYKLSPKRNLHELSKSIFATNKEFFRNFEIFI